MGFCYLNYITGSNRNRHCTARNHIGYMLLHQKHRLYVLCRDRFLRWLRARLLLQQALPTRRTIIDTHSPPRSQKERGSAVCRATHRLF